MKERLKKENMAKQAIWKYPLEVTDKQILEIPGFEPELLTVQVQNGVPCLWAVVKPEEPKRKVWIEVVGTGQPLNYSPRKYIGTFQLGPSLVFHVFNKYEFGELKHE